MKSLNKYIAEFIGTMILVFLGCGSVAIYQNSAIMIAFAFGFTFAAMFYAIGPVSGGHMNPAVSFAKYIDGSLKLSDLIGYVAAQILGAFAGIGLIINVLGKGYGFGANTFNKDQFSVWSVLLVEIVLTFIFVLVFISVNDKAEFKGASGAVIGLSLAAVHFFGIPFTLTSVNPARSIAPAVVTALSENKLKIDALSQLWIYILAPIVGGILAVLFFRFISTNKKEDCKLYGCNLDFEDKTEQNYSEYFEETAGPVEAEKPETETNEEKTDSFHDSEE